MAFRDKAASPPERSGLTLYGQAIMSALVALLVTGRTGWTQDLPREQNQWRTVMGPSVLNVEQEKDKAARPGSEFTECMSGCPTMVGGAGRQVPYGFALDRKGSLLQ
jgi:hypothetical protein